MLNISAGNCKLNLSVSLVSFRNARSTFVNWVSGRATGFAPPLQAERGGLQPTGGVHSGGVARARAIDEADGTLPNRHGSKISNRRMFG